MSNGTRTPASALTPGAIVHGTGYTVGPGTTTTTDASRPVISAERQGGRMRTVLGAAADGSGPATLDVAYPAEHVLIVTPAPAQGERVASDDLNTWAEFGSVFRVHADGTLSHARDDADDAAVYAPEVVYVDADPDTLDEVPEGWHALRGYTGQHGYRGPIMHPSEFLGGRMADDVLSTPGLYVVVTVDDYTEDDEPAGWAVITRPDEA